MLLGDMGWIRKIFTKDQREKPPEEKGIEKRPMHMQGNQPFGPEKDSQRHEQ
jgi:hypothetical protein